MKLHYYCKDANFGDAINVWLWDRLLPGCLDDDERLRFSGIGSVLSGSMPNARRWIVFTSGVGYPPLPSDFDSDRWSVIAVRGPLSANVLGLSPNAAVTDGAVLLAGLPEYAPLSERQRDGIVFVPHHRVDRTETWKVAAELAGVEYLSPVSESRAVIERIRRARLVLADAMHAAIVADAMRVPWVPLMTSPQINTFKWLDWTLSMKVPYAPAVLPAPTLASRARNLLLPFRGERHAFMGEDAFSALARFQRRSATRQRPWWQNAVRLGRRIAGRLDRHFQAARSSGWHRAVDEALERRAAAAIISAASGPSYLSDDQVLSDRLQELQSRLELVRLAALAARRDLGRLPSEAGAPAATVLRAVHG